MRHDKRYENDLTPSQIVVERYRKCINDEESDSSLALVHYRGGQEEFDLGIKYSTSSDPLDRKTGADILAQLGWADRTFLNESVAALIPLLDDPEDDVICAAAVALGHRGDSRAIPRLAGLANHPNELVRLSVVNGLSGHEEELVVRTLIQLTYDPDRDVRNWAVFGVGSLIRADSPEIRDALRKNLSDPDHEIRGEAIVGLAERRDESIFEILVHEWESAEIVNALSLEAAEIVADSRLLEPLKQLKTELPVEDDPYFSSALEAAIKACKGEAG